MAKLTYEETVRADAVLDMQKEILQTVAESMTTHGDEAPDKALAMIAASFIMSIETIDESFETNRFSLMILEMLKMKQNKTLQ